MAQPSEKYRPTQVENFIVKKNESLSQLPRAKREEQGASILAKSNTFIGSLEDDEVEMLALQISESIRYEIDQNGALLLPKTPEAIYQQFLDDKIVILPCKDEDGKNYFHRVAGYIELLNDKNLVIIEAGSLVKNHEVSTHQSGGNNVVNVDLPDYYSYQKHFTPGAAVLQATVAKIVGKYPNTVPLILATSRAKASSNALLEAGFRLVNFNKYQLVKATTCDKTCVPGTEGAYISCTSEGVHCNACLSDTNIDRKDNCMLYIHESTTDERLEEIEIILKSKFRDALNLRNELGLSI